MADFMKVCKKGDIPVGSGKTVEVNGKPVALFNVDGQLCAISNTCRHKGGPLGEGELDGKIVTCPWHGWRYDVTTGGNETNPSMPIEKYPVKVDGEEVLVSA